MRRVTVLAAIACMPVAAAPAAAQPGWKTLEPAILPRVEAAAEVIDGRIYQTAGFNDNIPSTAVERYDIATGRWDLVAPMPVSINHTAAAVHDGKLYLVGGYMGDPATFMRGDGLAVAIFLEYDPATDRWRELPPPPTKRGAVAADVIGDELFVAGGWNTTQGDLSVLEIYDFRTGRWRRGPDMQFARNHVVGTAAGGKFYAVGGHVDLFITSAVFKYVERYDPARDVWERVADMNEGRSGSGAVTVGDRVVVYGGENVEDAIASSEIFDPRTGGWSPLPDMPTPRHGLGDVAVGNRVYAIAGSPVARAGESRVNEVLDIPARSGEGATVPALELAVRPARVTAGRRVRIRFHVSARTAGRRQPVGGVTIRFGGATLRTDTTGRAAGRATFLGRLASAGSHRARARHDGFRPDSVRVTVRRRAGR